MPSSASLRRRLRAGALVATLAGSLAAAASEALLAGRVLDPSGQPLQGFRLVFREAEGEAPAEYTTEPTDALGRYSIRLPAPASYVLVGAVGPDGARLEVPALPQFPVEPGTRRLDVRLQAPAAAAVPQRARKLPWWRIGGAVGAVLVLWETALEGDEEERPASPFRP